MIDLQHLRVFVRASELNSFTKAAIALGLAQPTVSRVIRELEDEWDGQLFYRTGRGVTLSEFGEVAFARAKTLLGEAEQASEDLRAFSRLPTGVVSIALPPSLIPAVVPELVDQLRREVPGIRLQIFEGFSDQIERWLAIGDIEVGIYSKYREQGHGKEPALFASNLMLAGFTDRAELPRQIAFADLAGLPLVLPALPNGLRTILEATARRKHVALNVVVDADSTAAQKHIAQRCGCYMVKAHHTLLEESAKGIYSTSLIVNPVIERYVVLATTQQRPLSRSGREVALRATGILKGLY